eukprot:8637367-Heterocapsa_arctica.AAC.1
MGGVLITIRPVDPGKDETIFAGVVILKHVLKFEIGPPSILDDRPTFGACFRGVVGCLFEPSILIFDGEVKIAEDNRESRIR